MGIGIALDKPYVLSQRTPNNKINDNHYKNGTESKINSSNILFLHGIHEVTYVYERYY